MVSEQSKESMRGGRRVCALAAAAAHKRGRVSVVYFCYIIHVHYVDENARIAESAGSNKQDRVAWSRSEATRPNGSILLPHNYYYCCNIAPHDRHLYPSVVGSRLSNRIRGI